MAVPKVPTPTQFVLNRGTTNENVLLISPGGSSNTIEITGMYFTDASKFIMSDDRDPDSYPNMPAIPTTVNAAGTLMTGTFTALGPLPISPSPPNSLPAPTSAGAVIINVTVTTTGIVGGVTSGKSVQEATPI